MSTQMTLKEFVQMVIGYEEILEQAQIKGDEVMKYKFPPCEDPKQRQREFLDFVDHLSMGGDQEDALYYRQLSVCIEGLLWISRHKRMGILIQK